MEEAERLGVELRTLRIERAQLWFTDARGRPWRFAVLPERLDAEALRDGLPCEGDSVAASFLPYIRVFPDPSAVFPDPFAPVPTAAIMCDVTEGRDPGSASPGARRTLRAAADALESGRTGASATLRVDAEFSVNGKDGRPAGEEACWDALCDLRLALAAAGVRPRGFRFGPAPGQGRVRLGDSDPVRAADQAVLFAGWARALAARRGLELVFGLNDPYRAFAEAAAEASAFVTYA